MTYILIWGVVCFAASVSLCLLMVFTDGRSFWFVPAIGLGLPTIGLILALLGLIRGTRPCVRVFVRLLPANHPIFARVEAKPVASGRYRIVSPNPRIGGCFLREVLPDARSTARRLERTSSEEKLDGIEADL